jgi:site-specific DNA-methyltransferase (cytosine-N4-specific)
VTIFRIRLKDSYTRLWWLSPTERPKASNRRVLKEYSPAMKKLLQSGRYNAGKRPSEHDIGKTSFLKNNKGAIPPNVLIIPNTSSFEPYQVHCKNENLGLQTLIE